MFKYLQHKKYNRLLLPYIEGELDSKMKYGLQKHISGCERCREEVGKIEFSKKALQSGRTEVELYNSNFLWKRIAMKIESADTLRSSAIQGWSFQRTTLKPVLIGFTIVLISAVFGLWSGLLKFGPSDERVKINHSGFAFDLGLYLDIKKMPNYKEQLYDNFNAKSVGYKEISEHPTLNTNCYLNLKNTCNVNRTRLLSSNGKECLEFSTSISGKQFVVLQQNAGTDWSFGNYEVRKESISGVDCFSFEDNGVTVVNWKGKTGDYIIVGDLNKREIEMIVAAL